MNDARTRYLIWLLVAALACTFVLLGSGLDMAYVIPKRLLRLGSIVTAGVCIGVSSVIFQTIAGNRILTPAIMGYEAIYLLFQALLILYFGTHSLVILGRSANALVSIVLMLGYSWAIHHWLFRAGRSNVYLLLVGLVLSMVLGTFTDFIQLKISPGEFSIFQGFSYATFNKARPEQLLYSSLVVAAVCMAVQRCLPLLDVLALGREQSLSLGVDYRRSVQLQLGLIAVLVAVSTSLVGPTAFMGVFVANITYALVRSTRHRLTLPTSCAIAIGMFIVAQFLVEQLFNYATTVSILVNLVCGGYFLALMVRTRGVS